MKEKPGARAKVPTNLTCGGSSFTLQSAITKEGEDYRFYKRVNMKMEADNLKVSVGELSGMATVLLLYGGLVEVEREMDKKEVIKEVDEELAHLRLLLRYKRLQREVRELQNS